MAQKLGLARFWRTVLVGGIIIHCWEKKKQKRAGTSLPSFFLYPKYVDEELAEERQLSTTLMKVQESKKMERWWCS